MFFTVKRSVIRHYGLVENHATKLLDLDNTLCYYEGIDCFSKDQAQRGTTTVFQHNQIHFFYSYFNFYFTFNLTF